MCDASGQFCQQQGIPSFPHARVYWPGGDAGGQVLFDVHMINFDAGVDLVQRVISMVAASYELKLASSSPKESSQYDDDLDRRVEDELDHDEL